MISDEQAELVTGGEDIKTDLLTVKEHAVQNLPYGATTEMEKRYCQYCKADTMQYVTVKGYVCSVCKILQKWN